jgi:drug/metabolite transporter (DMT)-like permease
MGRPMGIIEKRGVLGGLIGLLCLIWGSTWYAIKVGLQDMPPFFAAGVRYLAASAIIAALALAQGVREPRGRTLHMALVVLGLSAFAISFGVVYWGEQYLPAGLAAVIFATHPLLVALVAAQVLPDEDLSARKLAGIGVGFLGVAVLMLDDVALSHPRAPLAAAVVLVAPAMSAVTNVGIKKFGAALHPYNLTSLPMFYAGLALIGVSLIGEDWGRVAWSERSVAALVYLTVCGSTVAVVTFYALLRRVSVSRLALISYIFPVVAVVLDVVVAGERFGARAWAGSALVVAGIVLAGIRRRAAVAPVGGTRG